MNKNKLFEDSLAEHKPLWAKFQSRQVREGFDIPDKTLNDCFNFWSENKPNHAFIIHRGQSYTFKECNIQARKIANALLRLGVHAGDRIILYLPNCPTLMILCVACFKLGAVLVVGNPLETPREMKGKINDCGAKVAVCDRTSRANLVSALCDADVRPEFIIACDLPDAQLEDLPVPAGVPLFDLETVLQNVDDKEPCVALNPDDTQVLQYTSGTTGISKACCHTNRGYVCNGLSASLMYSEKLQPTDWRTVVALPMSHIAGFTVGITCNVVNGGTAVLLDELTGNVEEILKVIEEHKITIWPVVPTQLKRFVNNPALHAYDISSLKVVVCGSAPLPKSIIEKFNRITGIGINEGYGLTEALRSVTLSPFDKWVSGKVGIPYPNVDVLIVDLEGGKVPLPIGEKGEIIVRSPCIMRGYWNNAELTDNQLKEGWLYTGDIGFFDENGFLEVVSRKKNMIIVSGFNVYPREVDEVLMNHPDVIDSCTFGVPDSDKGELVKSCVVIRPGSTLSADEIRDYCYENLTRYKVPKVIEFLDNIPLTKSGKHDVQKLQARG